MDSPDMNPTDDEINAAIDLLRSHGYQVVFPEGQVAFQWETPAHFCERVGIAVNSLQRTLTSADRAGVRHETKRSHTLRTLVIRSNPDLDAYIQRNRRIGAKSPNRPPQKHPGS
jgi:hypothetical protein